MTRSGVDSVGFDLLVGRLLHKAQLLLLYSLLNIS
jgi:hypothetical protein